MIAYSHHSPAVSSAVSDQANHTPIANVDEVLEIQKALEKLDLDGEISEVTRTLDSPAVNVEPLNKPESKDLPNKIPRYVKPFACDAKVALTVP